MNNDLKDILANSNKDIDNQELLQYLSQQLDAERQHGVEKNMVDDAFLNDAVEGLQQVENPQKLTLHVEELQHALAKQIEKKNRFKKRRFKDNPQQYLYIILVLLLLMLCFVVFKKWVERKNTPGKLQTTQQQIVSQAKHSKQ